MRRTALATRHRARLCTAAASFPPAWCERTGPEGGARIDTVIGIADNYWSDPSRCALGASVCEPMRRSTRRRSRR
jgi:hypothetical protein